MRPLCKNHDRVGGREERIIDYGQGWAISLSFSRRPKVATIPVHCARMADVDGTRSQGTGLYAEWPCLAASAPDDTAAPSAHRRGAGGVLDACDIRCLVAGRSMCLMQAWVLLLKRSTPTRAIDTV